MKKYSMEFKIPLFIMLFAVSCVALTGFLLDFIISDSIKGILLNQNFIVSRMISQQTQIYLEDAKSTVVTAANFSTQSHGDLSLIEKEIFRIHDNFSYFDLIFYMDKDARIVFSNPSNSHVKDMRYDDRDYYRKSVMDGEVAISSLLMGRIVEIPHYIISAPVFDKNGNTIGLIGTGMPIHNIMSIVEKTQSQFNGKIWIADPSRMIAVHPDVDNRRELVLLPNIPATVEGRSTDFYSVLQSCEESILHYKIDGEQKFGAVTFIPEINWMVVVEQSEAVIAGELRPLRNLLKLATLAVLVFAMLIGFMLARSMTNPIKALSRKVRKLGYGQKDSEIVKPAIIRGDEIEELNEVFDDMTARLSANIQKLTDSMHRENRLRQYLDNILKSVMSGILVINKRKKVTVFNQAAEAITGFHPDEFIGRDIHVFLEKTNLNLNAMIENVVCNAVTIWDEEKTITDANNNEFPIALSASPVLSEDESVIGVVFLFRDISKLKEVEEELKRKDRMQILGELSAAIIHDIGNPIAGMGNLIEILGDDSYDETSKREAIAVLEEEVRELNHLVISFLEFSKKSKIKKEWLDINELIKSTVSILKFELISKKAELIVDYLNPADNRPVMIDRRAFRQILVNIIKNAIDAIDTGGTVTTSVHKQEGRLSVSVSDNGAGMTKEHQKVIFDPFLTTKANGTGLGLSIVYKLVQEMGGQIHIKSSVGVGTEITIVIPI